MYSHKLGYWLEAVICRKSSKGAEAMHSALLGRYVWAKPRVRL